MTRQQAIAKAKRKHERTGQAILVTQRTNHPAYPGQTVYLAIAAADKYAWAPDETLVGAINETPETYAAGVANGSTLPATMTPRQMSAHCQRVIESERA